MDATIQKANEKVTFLANGKEMLRLYNMREMAQIDHNSDMLTAKADGEKAKAFAIAKNLMSMNLPIDQIITATGLTRSEVEGLK